MSTPLMKAYDYGKQLSWQARSMINKAAQKGLNKVFGKDSLPEKILTTPIHISPSQASSYYKKANGEVVRKYQGHKGPEVLIGTEVDGAANSKALSLSATTVGPDSKVLAWAGPVSAKQGSKVLKLSPFYENINVENSDGTVSKARFYAKSKTGAETDKAREAIPRSPQEARARTIVNSQLAVA